MQHVDNWQHKKRMMNFKKHINNELDFFEQKITSILSTKDHLLKKIINYLCNSSGKRIRPMCAILGAGLINNITEKTYRGAMLVELIHTATLIHDDIVDDAHIRRNSFTVNSIWKNKIAVLTGDYFLAKSLKLAVKEKDYEILNLLSEVVEKIVEGELIQIEKTKRLNLLEKDYFNIIKLKTASLFEASFMIGAFSEDGLDKKNHKKLKNLGVIIGILFQIRDDILDYDITKKTGKHFGNDIQEGKINLPLLYSIEKMSFQEKNIVYRILRKKTNTLDEVKKIHKLVIRYRGLEKAEKLTHEYHKKAIQISQNFPDSRYKKTVILMLDYLINRSK